MIVIRVHGALVGVSYASLRGKDLGGLVNAILTILVLQTMLRALLFVGEPGHSLVSTTNTVRRTIGRTLGLLKSFISLLSFICRGLLLKKELQQLDTSVKACRATCIGITLLPSKRHTSEKSMIQLRISHLCVSAWKPGHNSIQLTQTSKVRLYRHRTWLAHIFNILD